MSSAQPKSDRPGKAASARFNGRARPLRLTPADAGRELSLEEFEHATGEEGWRYELIDGRVEVSPVPELPHDSILFWLNGLFLDYSRVRPEVVNYLSNKARIFIPGRPAPTCPEPDFAVYRNFPLHLSLPLRHWRDVSPILVVEVLSEDNQDKDLVRNVALYLQSPTIREYWILDRLVDPDHPTLQVRRKRGRMWLRPIDVPFGGTYTTGLLPGFTLVVNPYL